MSLLPSQCRDSGDIKYIRNMCNLRFFGYMKIVGFVTVTPLVYVRRVSASWLDYEVRSSRVLSRSLLYVGRASASWLHCEVGSSPVLS